MPTIRAASTPSRSVTIKACNILGISPCDFENEFQFQLYKDSVPRQTPSTRDVTRGGDLCHTTGRRRDSESAQKTLRSFQLRKQLFLGAELGGMDTTPAAVEFHG